jgi:adenylyltransferase/sulfurtransferase
VLNIVSDQRRLKLRGRAFREFTQRVVPLLDGTRSVDEIHAAVGDVFQHDDLTEALEFLEKQGVLANDTALTLDAPAQERLRPQLNVFHDLGLNAGELQQRLAVSRVTIIGLTPIGVAAARALAAAGVGSLRAADTGIVGPTDTYFNSEFRHSDIGRRRVEALALSSDFEAIGEALTDDEQVAKAVSGAQFVVNALDDGNLSLMYRLNRVCLREGVPFVSAATSALEVAIGPTVVPGATACFMCYRMRLIACAANPEAAFAYESHLDRRRTDDSLRGASLVFGTAIAGQLAALEVLKTLGGISEPATRGRVRVLDLRDMSSTMHVVLRKPWCPACGEKKPW